MASAEEIYGALTRGRKEWENIREMCKQHKDGPFRKISRSKDSVLQKALYSGDVELVLMLLADAKLRFTGTHEFEDKLMKDVNIREETILHMAATQDSCLSAARKICKYADLLLLAENNVGEFPIFSAVRYGQIRMFKFLHSQMLNVIRDEEYLLSDFYKIFNERKNEHYTILHIAIYNEHFELALYIARKFPGLINKKDHQQMTGLHMLAMNSSAFRDRYWKILKLLLPSPFPAEISRKDSTDHEVEDDEGGSGFSMTIPCWKKFKQEYRSYQAALALGSLLVTKCTKWIDKLETSPVADADAHRADFNSDSTEVGNAEGHQTDVNPGSTYGEIPDNIHTELVISGKAKIPTPLILATKFGCLDIALQIMKEHPQTVEQVDQKYGSILHLAIKHRRIKIFEAVEKMKMQMRRLVRLLDKDQNSILHMVALNTTQVKAKNGTDHSILQTNSTSANTRKAKRPPWEAEEYDYDSRSPAFVLQDDLRMFKRVEDILKTHYHKIPNKDLETADQLFAAKKEQLRENAQEWMKRTAENCSLIAVLIATVAFAAAYTVPGGTDDKNGSPVLLDQTFFLVFTVADILSLASTLTSVVVFLAILSSSYRLGHFKELLPQGLVFGISCLIFSLTMMMLAFAATVILMIRNRQQWTRIAIYAVAFLPATVLAATFLPFYFPLIFKFENTKRRLKSILPQFNCPNKEKMFSLRKTKKSKTSSEPSNEV